MNTSDLIVVGGGLVGLSVAYQYSLQNPTHKIILLEKEQEVCQHQSGRNSGVIHSGIYYKPGSLKAKNCMEGKRLLEEFCETHGISFRRCGKVIVAVDESEIPALERIHERGKANGVACEMISAERMREIEPHVAGTKAIFVPGTGVVDFKGVAKKLAQLLEVAGHQVIRGCRVLKIHSLANEVVFDTTQGEYKAKQFVNCAGLHSDRILEMSGGKANCKIVPFRGEYYLLTPEAASFCKTLIYPVPNPAFPFLGVHFTRSFDDQVECGPNAVLALAREGYTWSKVNLRDLVESLTYSGFHKLATKYWREGFAEILRSISRQRFLKALQRLMPEVRDQHLLPALAGVRAQAVTPQGNLVDDFEISQTKNGVHIINAPSPAATSCLSLGSAISSMLHS